MSDRQQTATAAAERLRAFADTASHTPVLVGFDGFVDSIIRVVQKRSDPDHFTEMPTIKAFGERILAADGKSANFEFVTTQEKLGGNGPIMANAMLEATLRVAYIGALGRPNVHPIFCDFVARTEAYPVCDPGFTDAVEFGNGKLMLGKYAHMAHLNAEMVQEAIPEKDLEGLVARSKLFGFTNWTMLPKCESVYELIVSLLPEKPEAERPFLFVDFADPAKRVEDDLRRVCRLLGTFEPKAKVVLGLNLSEAGQVMGVLGLGKAAESTDAEGLTATAEAIRAELNLSGVVVHPREGAAASLKTPDGTDKAHFRGPYIQEAEALHRGGRQLQRRLLAGPARRARCPGLPGLRHRNQRLLRPRGPEPGAHGAGRVPRRAPRPEPDLWRLLESRDAAAARCVGGADTPKQRQTVSLPA